MSHFICISTYAYKITFIIILHLSLTTTLQHSSLNDLFINNIAFKSYNNLTTLKSHCKYYFKNLHLIDEDLEVQKEKVAWSRSHNWQITELFILTTEMNHLWWKESSLRWKGLKNYCKGQTGPNEGTGGARPLHLSIPADTRLLAAQTKGASRETSL